MDQDDTPEELNDSISDEYEEITKFLGQVEKQFTSNQPMENKIVVFLLGNSRVGKSTMFHLLQGDKLVKDSNNSRRFALLDTLKKNFMGSDGLSFTKVMNFFTTSGVIIVDTPGFNDTNDGYDEVISQLNMAKTLNKCKTEKCKEILFLALAKFDEDNYNDLKETFKRVYENFPEDLLPLYLQKIRFVITKSTSDKTEMDWIMKDILKKILTQNINIKTKQIIQYFLDHQNQIFYFPQSATEQQQNELYNQIHDFIRTANFSAQGYNEIKNSVLEHQFQMTISDKGFIILNKFLLKVQRFYENELSTVYDKIVLQISSVKDVELKFKICKEFQNAQQDPLYFQTVPKLLMKLNELNRDYQLGMLPLARIQKANQLFVDGWMDIIFSFQSQKRYFNISMILQISQCYRKITDLSIKISRELEAKYKNINENHAVLFKQMVKITLILNQKKDHQAVAVSIGNRQSGKSTAINLQFPSMFPKFIPYKPIDLNDKNNQINPDFIIMGQQNQDIVIEFQEFSLKCLPFVQYLYQHSIEQKNIFQIYVVLDENSKKYPTAFQALEQFIKKNDFNCNKLLTIITNSSINNIQQVLNILPINLIFLDLKQVSVRRMKKENGLIRLEPEQKNNTKITSSLTQEQLKNIDQESIYWLKVKMKEIFYRLIQNIDLKKESIWEQTNQVKEFKILIELSQLLPIQEQFAEKFEQQLNYFQLPIPKYQSRYDQLQELHKKLIEEKNIVQIIDQSLSFIEKQKKKLEVLSLQLVIVEEPNIRLDVKVIKKISEIFPIYFYDQFEIKEEIEFLRIISYKLYEEPFYNPSFEWKYLSVVKDKFRQTKKIEYNSLQMIWQLLKQIISDYKKLQYLLRLMQESQSRSFQYFDCALHKKWFYQFKNFFIKQIEFSANQKLLKETLEKHQSVKLYDKFEKLL